MSIILSLFLLFLSLHSCNARVIKVANNDPANDFHHYSITKENDEKLNRGGGRHVLRENGVKDSASKKSFRVPQKKRGEDEEAAGFNLDYLPPKTHPPSHN